ncbi:MAG: phosphotransferase [Thermaerobacter sp.]|nr:phosphotransferase [Thermaerobacter sp.]
MESHLIEQLTDDVVEAGAALFGVSRDQLSPCHGSMNFVYQYPKSETTYILRFTPGAHRRVPMVHGEVAWLRYLAAHGVAVSSPIPSERGRLVEVVPHDQGFTVTAFVKAPGRPVTYPDCLHDHELYYRCGQVVGRLHAASVSYVPASSALQRPTWRENFYQMRRKTPPFRAEISPALGQVWGFPPVIRR